MKVPPAAVINIIRENLNDRYRKGFPIIKELVQNADDASARHLHLGWVGSLSGVQHPLLHGPALFVVNDGEFKAADGEAIDCIGLSSKASSKFSVGKFGLGLKSIFHLCESFFYVAIDDQTGQIVAHIVNPWADNQGQDEFHQGWADFLATDQRVITTYLSPVFDRERFFCLWIPLRRQDQLQGRAPITKDFPGDENHPPQFLTDHGDTQLATLLPMLRSLQMMAIWLPDNDSKLKKSFQLRLTEGASRRRYPFDDAPNQALALNGMVEIERFGSPSASAERHKFGGFELFQAAPELERLKQSDLWPSSGSTDVDTGAYIIHQDKADPHCAICFSEFPANGQLACLSTSLAVFLSVDEPPFKSIELEAGHSNFALTLHGYFFLDAGRSRIEGLETNIGSEPPVDEQSLRFQWNARLFQDGTLPLLLPALQQFIQDANLSSEKTQALTRALAKSELLTAPTYRAGVCRDYQWVYCIGLDNNRWRLLNVQAAVFEIPRPPASDPNRPYQVFPALHKVEHITFRDMPRLTPHPEPANWDKHLDNLLNIPVEIVFGSQGYLDYLLEFLDNYAGPAVTQPPLVAQLLQLARRAFCVVDLAQLGSYRSRVQRFVKYIPVRQRFVLQPGDNLEKSPLFGPVITALLGEKLDALLVPGGFDDATEPAANQINAGDAVKLLSRLAKLTFERTPDDRFEELQTAIALKIINATQPGEREGVLHRCGNLNLFRGYDFKAGSEVSLRLHELNELREHQTLFKRANPQDMPITEGEAARLQKALPQARVVLIKSEVAGLLTSDIPTCTARACIQTLARLPELSHPEHRIDLLTSLSGQLNFQDSLNRRCLRYLLHGQRQHFASDQTPLLVGDETATGNIWARITDCVLALAGANWQVIERSLADNLNNIQRRELNIRSIGQDSVEALLQTEQHFAEINRRLQFTAEECDLLLRELPAAEPLKRLQIHETADGNRVAIDQRTYLADNFEISPALKKRITLLCRHANPDLADKQSRLAQPLTPEVAIAIAFDQAVPGNYWDDIMNALAKVVQPSSLPLDDLKQKKWLPLAEQNIQTPFTSPKPSENFLSKATTFLFGQASPQKTASSPKPMFISPQDIIYLAELDEEVARLVALDPAFYDVQQLHDKLRQHTAFDKLVEFHIFPAQNEALDMLGQIMQDHAQYWLGAITALDTEADLDRFCQVFQAAVLELMPAYPVINAVYNHISSGACLEYLLPHLKQPIKAERMVKLLEFLAEQHAGANTRDKKGVLEIHGWYLAAAVRMPDFAVVILPRIKLLNQCDEWKSPAKLCYNVAGIDKGDLLCHEQGRIIPTDRANKVAVTTGPQPSISWPTGSRDQQFSTSVAQLKAYFKAWEGALERREIVGGLLCLLGDYPDITDLTCQYLGHWDIDKVRDMVDWKPIDAILSAAKVAGYGQDIHAVMREQRFLVVVTAAEARTQTVISLTGQLFDAQLTQETNLDNLIVGDEHKKHPAFIENDLQINHLCLRQVNPARHPPERLSSLLRATSAWILENIYCQQAPNLNRVWEELEQSEQLDIQLTQALLLESAFFYLRQLGVQADQEIGPVLRAWENARRQQVQEEELRALGRPVKSTAREDKQQAAENLRQLLENSQTAQRLILNAVRLKVRQYQYKPQSIPFELFQNADDAVVELVSVTNVQTEALCVVAWDSRHISLFHWGRPINEFRFGDFDGRDWGYDRDLEKMLVLSYSDKTVEDSAIGVTGKFGLGFKSVFLITDQPRVLSGRLGFQVVGGLYPGRIIGEPFENLQAKISRESPNLHQRGTLFELPLTADVHPDEVMKEFKRLVHIMLVFSKRIRRCKLYPGSEKSIEIKWQGNPVLNCQHITFGQLQPVVGQLVGQNKPALVCETAADGALLLLLGARGFEQFPEYVPTLWVTAPTQEKLDLGFAINGQFDLDVGRAQLARVSAHNHQLACAMGNDIGLHLCQLFTEAQEQWPAFRQALNLAEDAAPYDFWASLWILTGERFSSRLVKSDYDETVPGIAGSAEKSSLITLLQEMLWGNHDLPYGMGRLVIEQSALPSQLRGRYRVLTRINQVAYATKGVLETGLQIESETRIIFDEIVGWPAFNQRVQPGAIIAGRVKRALEKLLPGSLKCEDLSLARIIGWEIIAADKENRVNMETAQRLGQVITPQFMADLDRKALLEFEELRSERGPLREARFLARDGKHHPARELVIAIDDTDNAEPDEQLRAAFAPDNRVLVESYKGPALQFFKACRQQMLARAREELAGWSLVASNNQKRKAALEYILQGEQGRRLANILTEDRDFHDKFQKSWLPEIQASLLWDEFSPSGQMTLKGLLKLEEQLAWPIIVEPPTPPKEKLMQIYECWQTQKQQFIPQYEKQVYPDGVPALTAEFNPSSETERQDWLILFMLGSFYTMGRTTFHQHRGFLQICQERGWLQTFAAPEINADAWINILEDYIDSQQLDSQFFYQWMKQFVSIYQLSRWLPDYIEVFLSADRYPSSFTMPQITSPRTNLYLQGGGIDPPQFTRTLGIGAYFVMRELVRQGILKSPHIYEHCYVPTAQVRKFFNGLGCNVGESPGADDSRQIYRFLVKHLGENKATFDLSFDLPFQFWNAQAHQFTF